MASKLKVVIKAEDSFGEVVGKENGKVDFLI